MPSNDEHDWIFDFVLQFLESDKFDAAVMDFVDEKCFVFENEEENKFEYTDIHKEFRDHIEALISSNLGELGITSDMFFDSCEKGRNNRDINTQVFERMIAMEDFETFKKLMTKRNMELQLETIRTYNTTTTGRKGERTFVEEEQEMQDALVASLRTGEGERSQLPIPEELRALLEYQQGVHDDKNGQIGEEEMQEILRRSLMEMEMIHRQAELEQADLEQAVALSLALEEERLRLQLVEEKSAISPSQSGSKLDDDRESKKPQSEAKNQDRVANNSSSKESYSATADVAEEKGGHSYGIEDDDGESTRRKKQSARPMNRGDGLADFAAPKPLQGRNLGVLGALPNIDAGANILEDKRKQAAEEIRKGQDQLSEQRRQEDLLRKQVGNVNPEEAEKRSRHMAEQRDKLIAIKKLERDKKVKEEEERRIKLNDDQDLPDGILRAKVHAQAASHSEAKGGDKAAGIDEKKRSAMRLALARRMKLDLIEGEELKLAQMQEDQFADLDRKLQQVEQLRRDNKEREQVISEQVLRQQETMAKNVQKSAVELKTRRP